MNAAPVAKPATSMHASAMRNDTKADVAAWQGQLRLGDRWATWEGDVGDGALHRHFAAQAILSDRPVRVFDAQGGHVEARYVLIDPLTNHRIEPGSEALLVYVEPGRHMTSEAGELLRPVRQASSLAMLGSPAGGRFWSAWLASPLSVADTFDARLTPAIERIESHLSFGPLSLRVAAEASCLSPERFRHLLAEQLGVPYKRYVLWRRLRLAAVGLAAGQDVTTAAHAAGFSDSAHFARTLKSTFGVTASQALTGR